MQPLPDWLGRDLVAGALPWAAAATPGSLPGFLDRYTLHHASWIGLFAEADQQATLLLRWASYWIQGDVSGAGRGPDAPILALRFEGVERSEVRLRERALASVVSGPTNRAADCHRTQLTDVHGGEATMVHAPTVRLLCLSVGREPLPLLVPAETV